MNVMYFIPVLISNFFFNLANKCLPIFFSIFLLDKGLTEIHILLIYILFNIGSLIKPYIYESAKYSIKNILISINILVIITILQYKIALPGMLYVIVFIQGIYDIFSKNSFQNIIYNISHNEGETEFFGRIFLFFSSLMGMIASLVLYIFQSASIMIGMGIVSFAIANIMLVIQNTKAFVYRDLNNKVSANIFYIYRHNFIGALLLFLVLFFTGSFLNVLPLILKHKYFTRLSIFRIIFFTNVGVLLANFIYIRFNRILYKHITQLCVLLMGLYISAMFCIKNFNHFMEIICLFIGFLHTTLTADIRNMLQNDLNLTSQEVRIGYNQMFNISSITSLIFAFLFMKYLQYGFFIFYTCIVILILFLYSFKEYLNARIYL